MPHKPSVDIPVHNPPHTKKGGGDRVSGPNRLAPRRAPRDETLRLAMILWEGAISQDNESVRRISRHRQRGTDDRPRVPHEQISVAHSAEAGVGIHTPLPDEVFFGLYAAHAAQLERGPHHDDA